MYCKNCGRLVNEKDKYCSHCGIQQIDQKFVSHDLIRLSFGSLVLLFFGVMFGAFKDFVRTGFSSGFVLVFIPMMAIIISGPQFISLLFNIYYFKTKSKWMLIFSFLTSLLSVLLVVYSQLKPEMGILFYLYLIIQILLVIRIMLCLRESEKNE